MTAPQPLRPVSRSSRDVDLEAAAPFVPWPDLYRYLRRQFLQGQHVAIIGPTGTGKTHLAFELAEIRSYVIAVATKPRDPLIEDAIRRGYHRITALELSKGVEYVDGRPLHPRLVYWPNLSGRQLERLPDGQAIRTRVAYQKQLIRAAFGWVEKRGHWTLLLDEGSWIYRDLGLNQEIDAALTQWRSNKSSVIILAQRPAWVGRAVLSQPTHIFLFYTGNREDAKSLGDITGADTAAVRDIVSQLDRQHHHFLYIDTQTGAMYRSVAPPR